MTQSEGDPPLPPRRGLRSKNTREVLVAASKGSSTGRPVQCRQREPPKLLPNTADDRCPVVSSSLKKKREPPSRTTTAPGTHDYLLVSCCTLYTPGHRHVSRSGSLTSSDGDAPKSALKVQRSKGCDKKIVTFNAYATVQLLAR